MAKIIYISGRGYSGSTMLDAMLGSSSRIESVGELVSGIKRYVELCSCGKTFEKCRFWSGVREEFENKTKTSWDNAAHELMRQAHLKNLVPTFFMSTSSKWTQTKVVANRGVFDAIAETASKRYIVDSSKEVTRALFLIKHHPEAKIIHLVKNPVTVLESTYYRLSTGTGFRFLRRQFKPKKIFWPALSVAAFGWLVGNMLAEIVRLHDKGRVIRIRYEDIVAEPTSTFSLLEDFLEVDLTGVKQKLNNNEAFEVGHNVGGNHMRLAKSFVFDPTKKSRGGLPPKYEKLVKIVCYPLMRRYGYIGEQA